MRAIVFAVTCLVALSGCLTNPNRPIQLLSGAGPIYPEEARSSGIEGQVTVVYDVTVEGTVANAAVVASEPPGLFDEAALRAVRSWRFNPRYVDGRPEASTRNESTLSFKLGEGDEYACY